MRYLDFKTRAEMILKVYLHITTHQEYWKQMPDDMEGNIDLATDVVLEIENAARKDDLDLHADKHE